MKVSSRPTFDELVGALDRRHQELSAASAGLLETIAYLDREGSWGDDETSLECFLSARYSVSSGTAHQWVQVARALRDLPAIRDAYSAGQISWDQLRPLTRFATAATEERWAAEAPRMRVGQLWSEARRQDRSRKQREMKSDNQFRALRMEWDEEKRFLQMFGEFAAEQGAALQTALEARAAEIELEEDFPPFDRHGAKLADALVEMLTSSGEEASPPTLVVHADSAVVTGTALAPSPTARSREASLAETESGVQLTDDAVRRIACDARIEWVLETAGRAVGIGRRGRAVPGWLLRALRYRDPECRFDGCSRKRSLVSHHIVHWANGGSTDLDNLIRLCSQHHRLVHECGWTVTGHPGAEVRFHRPRAGPRPPRPPTDLRGVARVLARSQL